MKTETRHMDRTTHSALEVESVKLHHDNGTAMRISELDAATVRIKVFAAETDEELLVIPNANNSIDIRLGSPEGVNADPEI